jgi:hypothetical protein
MYILQDFDEFRISVGLAWNVNMEEERKLKAKDV